MSVAVLWTSGMTRVILDYIDLHKGEQSPLLINPKAACDEIWKRLEYVTDDEATYAAIDTKKIDNKLTNMAKWGPCSRKSLFINGSSALDLDRAKQKDIYTHGEMEARKNPLSIEGSCGSQHATSVQVSDSKISYCYDASSGLHPTEPPTRKSERKTSVPCYGESDIAREDLEDSELPARKKTKSLKLITEGRAKQGRCSQRRKLTSISDNSRTPADTTEFRPLVTGDELTDVLSNTISGDQIRPDRSDIYSSVHNIQGLLTTTAVQTHTLDSLQNHSLAIDYLCKITGCFAHFDSQIMLDKHRGVHDKPEARYEPHNTSNQQWPNNDVGRSSNLEASDHDQELMQWTCHGQVAHHQDVGSIIQCMNNIQARIFDCTLELLRKLHINPRAMPLINITGYEQGLIDILKEIYGAQSESSSLTVARLTINGQMRSQLFESICAIVGAAVTQWALRPLPQGAIGRGLFKECHEVLFALSPALHDHVTEKSTKKYLNNNVKPHIPRVAYGMATELFRLLRQYLPFLDDVGSKASFRQQENRDNHTAAQLAHDQSPHQIDALSPQAAFIETPAHQWPLTNEPHQIFTRELATAVFEPALMLRVEMETYGPHAQYKFHLPKDREPLDFAKHVAVHKHNNQEVSKVEIFAEAGVVFDSMRHESNSPAREISFGLFPVVQALYKDTRDGPWRDNWVTIVKGIVHLWDTVQV